MSNDIVYINGMARKQLNLVRSFKAPIELVFRAWTDEQQLKQWWGPHGFTNPVCRAENHVGGKILIHMKAPDGMVFPMHGQFEQLVKPELLVFTSSAFEGDNGIDQLKSLNTVKLWETNGITTVQLKLLVIRSNATVDEALDGMEQGWDQSFDKLKQLLEGE